MTVAYQRGQSRGWATANNYWALSFHFQIYCDLYSCTSNQSLICFVICLHSRTREINTETVQIQTWKWPNITRPNLPRLPPQTKVNTSAKLFQPMKFSFRMQPICDQYKLILIFKKKKNASCNHLIKLKVESWSIPITGIPFP